MAFVPAYQPDHGEVRKLSRKNRPPSPQTENSPTATSSIQKQESDAKFTLGDVFWPANGPNFSALPGVGGMYVKGNPNGISIQAYVSRLYNHLDAGFGLIRGPPSAVGIPIYYFHPLQPPAFESGVYNGSITFIEGVADGRGHGGHGYGGPSSMHDDYDYDASAGSRPPNRGRAAPNQSEPSTPWIPMSKRDKQPKTPPPPPKASGWQQVLEEMAKRQKGGLKKVEEKAERKVGKLKTGKKKKGEFVDIIDELKYHLQKLQGKQDDEEEEEVEEVKEKTPKPSKEVKFSDQVKESSLAKESATASSSEAKASTPATPKPTAAKPRPAQIPLPPPVPSTWPPIPYVIPAAAPASMTVAHTAELTAPPQAPAAALAHSLAPLITDLPFTPPPNISTATTTNQAQIASEPGKYLIPIANPNALPVGLQQSQRSSSIPLPSGYYIPAPRLDMVEPGKYEFGGLTTQRQIDAINRMIRSAIHQSERQDDELALTARSASASLGSPKSQSSSPRAIELASNEQYPSSAIDRIRGKRAKKSISESPLLRSMEDSNQQVLSGRSEESQLRSSAQTRLPYNEGGLSPASSRSDIDVSDSDSEVESANDEDYDDDEGRKTSSHRQRASSIPRATIDVLQLSRTSDGHVRSHTHHAAKAVAVSSQLLLPSGFHSTVQRVRRAHQQRIERQDAIKPFELRRYDDEDLAAEMRRSLPTAHQTERPLTVPKDFESKVDQRLASKKISYRKSMDKTTFDRLPLCSYIDKVFTHDTSLNEGYDDIGKAFWTASLRRDSTTANDSQRFLGLKEKNAKYLTSRAQLSQSQAPQFSDVLKRRQEKTRLKLQQEQEEQMRQQEAEARWKEKLRLQALAAAQASGSYSPLLVPESAKRGIYIRKMIAKYGKQSKLRKERQLAASFNNDRGRELEKDDDSLRLSFNQSVEKPIRGSYSRPIHEDIAWSQVSSHPNYQQAMLMHENLVRQVESVDIRAYHKDSPNKFLMN
jgi:hypothetical protein